MPPKPQVFKSPDGKEFSTKAAWRDYMMATYYSFSNVKGAPYPMPRLPGSIDGQMYNISDCEDTELIVMDHCEQVQIDQVRNSKIFIGACESSMFIRNCDNCSFYIACRQLRLRDVTNCKFFCFSTAEVHIEYSNNVQFAPFNGGYPEQAQHLTKAKLPYLEHNLWYDIFDHNDPGKTREHWSLLPEAEYGPAWFPAGECERAIPLTKPGSVQRVDGDTTGDAGKESSLQSFALPHVAEAAAKAPSPVKVIVNPAERMKQATAELSMEAALLVASAFGKGIDVSVWLMEGAATSDTTVEHFNDRLISLALSVGLEEDWDTKRELEVAVGSKSLKNIKTLFSTGVKSQFIDVGMFLNCAQQKVHDYMSADVTADPEKEVDAISQHVVAPTNRSVGGTIISSVGDSVNSWAEEIEEPDEDEVNLAEGDSVSNGPLVNNYVSPTASKQHSPAPITASSAQKATFESPAKLSLIDRPGDTATNALLPDSPYDEEVAFDLDEEEEADTADGYRKRQSPRSTQARAPATSSHLMQASPAKSPVQGSALRPGGESSDPKRGNRSSASNASKTEIVRPTPSTDPVVPAGNARNAFASKSVSVQRATPATATVDAVRPKTAPAPKTANLRAAIARPSSARSAANRMSQSQRASAARARASSNASLSSSLYPDNIVDAVEEKIRQVVQQTDLYHLVQVHLGFIETYTMVPHRGATVVSTPRPRLTVEEIQSAFFQARSRFTEGQVLALMKLVTRYARDKVGEEVEEHAVNADVVAPGCRLSSEWLKKYMVHLRLTKKKSNATTETAQVGSSLEHAEGISATNTRSSRGEPLEFNQWLGAKLVEDRREVEKKPKEFQKALAGQKHALSKEELENYLTQHNILPDDLLKEEITLRVQSWSLDINGRKDYMHAWNLGVRKWDKESGEFYRRLKEDMKKIVSGEIRAKLLKEYAENLKKSEREKQSISKELFWRFQRAVMKAPVGQTMTWGNWLQKHQASETQLIAKSKQDSEERKRIMAMRKARKQAVAPLVEIEKKINEAADKLTTFHSIELRKCLVGLRKRAIAAGMGSGDKLLVTKDLFDSHMSNVLAARGPQLDPELRGLAEEARKSHEGFSGLAKSEANFTTLVDAIFSKEEANALAKAAQIKTADTEKANEEFNDWKARKQQLELNAAEATRMKTEAKLAEKTQRQKVADRAYRQWVKLRKTGQYISRVDKKPHVLPQPKRVDHDGKWSKDVEIIHPEVSYL